MPDDVFALDEHALDREWVNQPRLYYDAALELAHARTAHERAKAELELTVAELSRDIRNHPTTYGLPDKMPSVDVVEKTCVTDAKYARARDAVIAAKHDVDVLQAMVEALDHRKKALENLVHLRAMNYFSEPQEPKASRRDPALADRKASFADLGRKRDRTK